MERICPQSGFREVWQRKKGSLAEDENYANSLRVFPCRRWLIDDKSNRKLSFAAWPLSASLLPIKYTGPIRATRKLSRPGDNDSPGPEGDQSSLTAQRRQIQDKPRILSTRKSFRQSTWPVRRFRNRTQCFRLSIIVFFPHLRARVGFCH